MVILTMAIAHSKVTAQGQISVPASVRRTLAIGPGSVLEWHEDGDQVVVRRAGRFTSDDIHRSIFKSSPPRRTLSDLKEGVRRDVKRRRALR